MGLTSVIRAARSPLECWYSPRPGDGFLCGGLVFPLGSRDGLFIVVADLLFITLA